MEAPHTGRYGKASLWRRYGLESLGLLTAPQGNVGLGRLTEKRSTSIVTCMTPSYSFYLPVTVAMYTAGTIGKERANARILSDSGRPP